MRVKEYLQVCIEFFRCIPSPIRFFKTTRAPKLLSASYITRSQTNPIIITAWLVNYLEDHIFVPIVRYIQFPDLRIDHG